MKEIIFKRKNYKSYKDFYVQVYKDLEGKEMIDWADYDDLHYNADLLDEFLGYCNDDSNKYIFIGFDKEKIKEEKNYDDYEYNMVIRIFERFVKKYPNNKLEFRDE